MVTVCNSKCQLEHESCVLFKADEALKNENYWKSQYCQMYGCEAWSPTLREIRRLRVLENRILRRVFRPKRDENKQNKHK